MNGEWSKPRTLRVTPHQVTSSIIGTAAAILLIVASAAAGAGETEWRQLQQHAQISFQRQEFQEAERFAREALLEADSSLGAYHRATEESLEMLALVLRTSKKPDDALPFARRLVIVRMRRYGQDDPRTATALHQNADVLIALGQLNAAAEVQQAALQIFETKLGPDHYNTAAGLHNLGAIRLAQKRYAEAEGYLRRALAAKEKTLKPGDLRIAPTLDNLAVALELQGKSLDAQRYKRRAHAIRQAAARGQAPH